MPAVQETIERVRRIDVDQYKYGFVTDIETETIPKGLTEDTVRLISSSTSERFTVSGCGKTLQAGFTCMRYQQTASRSVMLTGMVKPTSLSTSDRPMASGFV